MKKYLNWLLANFKIFFFIYGFILLLLAFKVYTYYIGTLGVILVVMFSTFGIRWGLIAATYATLLVNLSYYFYGQVGITPLIVGTLSYYIIAIGMGYIIERFQERSTLIKLAIDLVSITDLKGNFSDINPAWEKSLGYTREEMLSNNVRNLIHPEDKIMTERFLEKLGQGQVVEGLENRYLTKDGSVRWLAWNSLPNISKEKIYSVGRDITKEKEALAQISLINNEIVEKNKELEDVYNKMDKELRKASIVHLGFFPHKHPQIDGIEIATYYKPAEMLGGDFYHIIQKGDQVIFYIVDVSGHGIDGALLNIFIRENINSYLLNQHNTEKPLSPKEILEFLEGQYRKENFSYEYLICVQLAVLDLTTSEMVFANAGIQVYPTMIDKEGKLSTIKCGGPPLTRAIPQEYMVFEEFAIVYDPGTIIFMTSDGLVEEMVENVFFEMERVEKILKENYLLPPQLLEEYIRKDFTAFTGQEQGQDDITFLIIQRALNKKKIALEVENSLTGPGLARDQLEEFIKPYLKDRDMFLLAFYEMVVNALEHGNNYEENKKVFIEIGVTQKYIEVTVEDQGDGFDWEKAFQEEYDFEELSERGRGLLLAKMSVDFITYNKHGNKVYFLKHL